MIVVGLSMLMSAKITVIKSDCCCCCCRLLCIRIEMHHTIAAAVLKVKPLFKFEHIILMSTFYQRIFCFHDNRIIFHILLTYFFCYGLFVQSLRRV